MLNGPIQGGIFPELRRKSARLMGEETFTVHPIGGIVPIMEQHMYDKLAEIILETKPYLPANRPTHLFGCGHPMLFPMAIALGIDLFDSAAYALFARDDRLLCPWGTEKFDQNSRMANHRSLRAINNTKASQRNEQRKENRNPCKI